MQYDISLLQVYFYIIIFGIHHRFKKYLFTIVSFVILSIIIEFNIYTLFSCIIGIMLSELINNIIQQTNIKLFKHDYIFQLIVIPFLFKFLLFKVVPQTQYNIGIVLAGITWSGIWLILWTIDVNSNNNIYYISWAIPCIISLIISFFMPNYNWIPIVSSFIITCILLFSIPTSVLKHIE